jgi:hypothetical protein
MPPRRSQGQQAVGAWRGGRGRVQPLLGWSALTLLAALALALAMVLAGLVVEPTDPPPPSKPPMQFEPPMGPARPQ